MNADQKYINSMKKQGFTKTCVWVPKNDTDKIQAVALAMRTTHAEKKRK